MQETWLPAYLGLLDFNLVSFFSFFVFLDMFGLYLVLLDLLKACWTREALAGWTR